MGYTRPITQTHESGSTTVGTWLPLTIGKTVYKFRVDHHSERARRIAEAQSGIGLQGLKRVLGVLATVPSHDLVIRRQA